MDMRRGYFILWIIFLILVYYFGGLVALLAAIVTGIAGFLTGCSMFRRKKTTEKPDEKG